MEFIKFIGVMALAVLVFSVLYAIWPYLLLAITSIVMFLFGLAAALIIPVALVAIVIILYKIMIKIK
jgi:hypothetical protein